MIAVLRTLEARLAYVPPPAMHALRRVIGGCPEPMIVAGGGHFVQEWGEPIARAALNSFDTA